jgi:glycosyltransferase involved in cell wall biosynthesis
MQSGAPVVISRDPALMEVAGGAAIAVDPNSAAELCRVIVQLMKDPQQRRNLREDGVRRAAQFTWRNTAVKTHDVYIEALRRF